MDNYIVRTTEDLLSDDICGEVFFDCTEKIIPAILDRAMRRITAFNVSEENPYYTSYEGILYSKDGKKVIKSPAKKSGSVKLHDGTEDICENAFAFSDIQSVTFPDSLKRIERSAFDSCYALTEIDFGNGIEHLGENEDGYIFNSCDSLEVLRFPKQLKSIGKSAFANSGVRAIAFNEGLESIATRAFYGSHLEKVELPASLKNCGSLCFSTVQRVIFNGDALPKGFISAITLDEFDSNDGVEAVKIYLKDIDKTIYIPKQMSQIGIETAIFHLEGCSLAEADTYLFDSAYRFANVADSAFLAAMEECFTNNNEEAKEFLKKNSTRIVDKLLEEEDESGLERISRLGVVSEEQLKRIGELAERKEWAALSAYVMNQVDNSDDEDVFSL